MTVEVVSADPGAPEARGSGLDVMRLETGAAQLAAIPFYRRQGYGDIAACGEYVASPTSVCIDKRGR